MQVFCVRWLTLHLWYRDPVVDVCDSLRKAVLENNLKGIRIAAEKLSQLLGSQKDQELLKILSGDSLHFPACFCC